MWWLWLYSSSAPLRVLKPSITTLHCVKVHKSNRPKTTFAAVFSSCAHRWAAARVHSIVHTDTSRLAPQWCVKSAWLARYDDFGECAKFNSDLRISGLVGGESGVLWSAYGVELDAKKWYCSAWVQNRKHKVHSKPKNKAHFAKKAKKIQHLRFPSDPSPQY